jgi:hypothetical protein
MDWWVDEMSSYEIRDCWDNKLLKWLVDEIMSLRNVMLMKWLVRKWIVEMASWQNGKL